MKAASCRPSGFFGGLVVVTVLCLALTPNLAAQGVDPGPRPSGNGVTQGTCTFIEANDGPFKFSTDGGLLPTVCDDVDQPPSNAPQPPAAGAGNIIANPGSLGGFWGAGLTIFSATATVVAPNPPSTIAGLGPSFNSLSCFSCHAQPAVGGASPGIVVYPNGNIGQTTLGPNLFFTSVLQNPEYIAASADDATNVLPCFIVSPAGNTNGCGASLGDFPTENFSNGPVVEVRFPSGFNPPAGSNKKWSKEEIKIKDRERK